MSVTLAVTPASGAITAKETFVRVDLTEATVGPRYRITFTKTGSRDLVSHEFVASSDGKHSWFNVMFPDDGTWAMNLVDDEDAVAVTSDITVL